MYEISTGLYSRNHPSAKIGGPKMIWSAESADSDTTKTSHVVRIDTIVFHMITQIINSPTHSSGPQMHDPAINLASS